MNFHTEGAFKAGGYVSLPVFTGENKKESVYAARINAFYKEIAEKAENICTKKGLKYYIEASVSEQDGDHMVILRINCKHRSKTIFSHTHKALWHKGVIKKDIPVS